MLLKTGGTSTVLCTAPTVFGASTDTIRSAISEKFSQSSKAIVKSIAEENGYIKVVASKGGIGEENEIIIDTAVALNRVNGDVGKWKNVSITFNSKTYSFTRQDFDTFRAGKINDSQFLKRIKKK
jgi:hypothetical protein